MSYNLIFIQWVVIWKLKISYILLLWLIMYLFINNYSSWLTHNHFNDEYGYYLSFSLEWLWILWWCNPLFHLYYLYFNDCYHKKTMYRINCYEHANLCRNRNTFLCTFRMLYLSYMKLVSLIQEGVEPWYYGGNFIQI